MKNFDFSKWKRPELVPLVTIVLGAVLLLNPDLGSAALASILGWVLVAFGAVGLFINVTNRDVLGLGGVFISLLVLVAGIYLLKRPLALASFFGVLLGGLLLLQGLGNCRRAKHTKEQGGFWIPGAAIGAVMSLVGLLLIFAPLTSSRLVMSVAGIVMIACGIANLTDSRKERKYIRQDPNPQIIDADE